MKNLSDIFAVLRLKNKSRYRLLFGCLLFSVLLMTAYCMMMYSPTVQNTLPEGGDSRKQVMMIFILSVIGCGAFVMYAAGLFLRHKSKETGVLLALGAEKNVLQKQMLKEILGLSAIACSSGMALGTLFAWFLWQIFRHTLIDTPEMALIFDMRAYVVPSAFSAAILILLALMLSRFLGRVSVLEIITEAHRAEPIRKVPLWYGPSGILLLILGALLGYFTPSFCIKVLHWYPPEGLTALCYLPSLAGLYILLLHTVVHGWGRGKKRYAHLIATSMMRFQGRQTVRNMLVVCVLVAGAYFASFYVPIMVTPAQLGVNARSEDYSFFYRAGQPMPSQNEIEALADGYGVKITGFVSRPSACLACDGFKSVETETALGVTYESVYREQLIERRFFSESSWNALTGGSLALDPGTITSVLDSEGLSAYWTSKDVKLITNPVTYNALNVRYVNKDLRNDLLLGCYVLDDADYESLTQGLTDEWKEEQVFFNAVGDNYDFAKALFYLIVSRSGPETAICDGYDRIIRERSLKNGEVYVFDDKDSGIPVIDLKEPDSSVFRLNWKYMPDFRMLDRADFVATMAVFLLLFVFIALLCFSAVAVILFVRSMTLAITNAWVYDDLRKLGASEEYLYKTAKEQTSRVFCAPVATGTLLIMGFYLLILWGNGDGGITPYELAGFGNCTLIVLAVSAAIVLLYRFTLMKICKLLGIKGPESIIRIPKIKKA